MDIYLVRHGETDGNRALRHQHPDTRLNERGKEQVAALVEPISALAPTHLITSTNLRAVETTRILADATGLIPITSALFEEFRRAGTLIGVRMVSLYTIYYIISWFYGKRHGDGETYPELIERIGAAQKLIEALPGDARVVVVSHSVFINLFIAHRCRGKRLTLLLAIRYFFAILFYKNTGIRHLRYDAGTGKCGWSWLS